MKKKHWFARVVGSTRAVLSLFTCAVAASALWASALSPAVAANTTVAIGQQPLTVQPSVPPNIVLMLDDSGSMAWSVMPDSGYLATRDLNAGLRNSTVNGAYYDPTQTYAPPPKAGSTPAAPDLYPNNAVANFPNAYRNPFTGTQTDDVTQAQGSSDNGSFSFYDSQSYRYSCGRSTCTGNYFAFAYTSAGGKVYHVTDSATCSGSSFSNCVAATDTSGVAAPAGVPAGQNVMNWYSYYSTRMKMAQSGLMSAFSGVNPNYRVGFGSINGNAVNALPKSVSYPVSSSNATYAFDDSLNGRTDVGTPYNKLAMVQPFGDGSNGTQKAALWNWIVNETPNGGTPLRKALQAVGNYYSDSGQQPWQSMPGDPGYSAGTKTLLACRASYAILTTDGFWNGAIPRVSGGAIGDVDGTPGPTITGTNGQSYSYSPALPYVDANLTVTPTAYKPSKCSSKYTFNSNNGYCERKNNPSKFACEAGDTWDASRGRCIGYTTTGGGVSNTLSDVAMYFWNNDVQPGIANQVPASTEDPAFWQHMVTFTMGLGFTPQYDGTGAFASGTPIPVDQVFAWAQGGPAIPGFAWPTPQDSQNGSGGNLNNISDLAHAAVNGHGAFFSATNPQAITAGLSSALKRVAERVGTGASLAANSTSLDAGTVVYQANYFTGTWKGDLKALPVDQNTGAVSTTPNWQASKAVPAPASRTIQTWNGSSFVAFANSGTGTPPNLSSAQAAALGGGGSGSTTAEAALINYLRGDSSQEQANGGAFRSRGGNVLGDVVHSQPVYSGVPNADEFINQTFNGTNVFQKWAVGSIDGAGGPVPSAASTRTPLIFIASNDGMLHGFNATTGVETYAYLPGAVITNGLKDFSDPTYGDVKLHQFYNDGELTIADAYVKLPGDSSPQWHTILIGTTGRGPAKAVYALDITNPAKVTPLWERSAGDGLANSDYIGQMVGKPVIAQTNNVSGATPSSSWAVLMGNGYNSTAGVSALLQFDLASGALSVHTTTDSSQGNGLAAPVVWMDEPSNGVGTVAYAGDLHGQVWSFALNDNSGASPTPTSSGARLFTAKDASGNVQPITAGMLAGRNPATNDVWLFFGTGEYLSVSDLSDINTQSWYGIIVQSSNSQLVSNLSLGRNSLVKRTITSETSGGGLTLLARTVSTATPNDMSGKSGWYLDLLGGGTVQQGERMIDPNQFQGNLLIGVTRIAQATDICSPTGSGWIMALNAFTGTAPASNFFDVNRDGFINAADSINGSAAAGVGFSASPNAPIFVGNTMEVSFDNGTIGSIGTSSTSGEAQRVNWRELTTQ